MKTRYLYEVYPGAFRAKLVVVEDVGHNCEDNRHHHCLQHGSGPYFCCKCGMAFREQTDRELGIEE